LPGRSTYPAILHQKLIANNCNLWIKPIEYLKVEREDFIKYLGYDKNLIYNFSKMKMIIYIL